MQVGAEPCTRLVLHTLALARGLLLQEATPPEVLREHSVPENAPGKRQPMRGAVNAMLWRIQHLDS